MNIRAWCVVCLLFFALVFPAAAEAGPQGNLEEYRHSGMIWSDVCVTDDYNPKAAAVADALNRAQAGAYPPTASVAVAQTQQESSELRVAPQPLPAVERSMDRMAVVDEAMDSYLKFQARQNILDAGIEVFSFNYEEEGLMSEKGTMYGVFADYRYRFKQNSPVSSPLDILGADSGINVFMMDGRFSLMRDGHYWSEDTGEAFDENFYSNEIRLMGGYELPVDNQRLIVMPYAGFGFRYLLDDNGGAQTTTGHLTYDRESHYFYAPLGIEARKFYHRGWSLRLAAEYDWFITGRQKSHLPSAGTIVNNQPTGSGMRASLRLAKEIDAMEFFVEPFARYWHISDSDVSGGGYEPRNTTEEYGARIGMRF